jgi:hypothetical protein
MGNRVIETTNAKLNHARKVNPAVFFFGVTEWYSGSEEMEVKKRGFWIGGS